MKKFLNRQSILDRAYDECLTEMFAKAQPSADYHQLLKDAEEFNYILEKYKTIISKVYSILSSQ